MLKNRGQAFYVFKLCSTSAMFVLFRPSFLHVVFIDNSVEDPRGSSFIEMMQSIFEQIFRQGFSIVLNGYMNSLQERDYILRVASCQLRVASCQLRVASCQLRVGFHSYFASCELRVASCELRVASCELRVGFP